MESFLALIPQDALRFRLSCTPPLGHTKCTHYWSTLPMFSPPACWPESELQLFKSHRAVSSALEHHGALRAG